MEEQHEYDPMPPPPAKYFVQRFSIPPEFVNDKRYDKYLRDVEAFWFDDMEEAIGKAQELAGGLAGFDAAFKFEDLP